MRTTPPRSLYVVETLAGVRPVRTPRAERPGGPRLRDTTCPLCDVVLSTRSSLCTHLVGIHNGQRHGQPKRCPDCGYKDPDPRSMGAHRVAKHGFDSVRTILDTIPGGHT